MRKQDGFMDILKSYKTILDERMDRNDVSSMPYYDGEYKPIDAMLQQFGVEQVMSWCLLNAFKYLWRCDKKHDTPIDDIKKAMWYLNKYMELYDYSKDRNA